MELIKQKFDDGVKLNPNATDIILFTKHLPETLQKEIADALETLKAVPAITSQEISESANKQLAGAKRLIKKVSDAGLEMRRPFNDITKEISDHEKSILSSLSNIVVIINNNITNFQREAARKAAEESERIRKENAEKMRIEQERITTIKNRILALQKNILDALASTQDVKELTEKMEKVIKLKFSETQYSEFIPEVVAMHTDCISKFQAKIDQLKQIQADIVDTGEDPGRALEMAKNSEAQEINEALNATAKDIDATKMNIAANTQMKTELQQSQIEGAKSVRKQMKYNGITDFNKIPRAYLMVDEKKVKEAIKAGVYEIPGILIGEEISNFSR